MSDSVTTNDLLTRVAVLEEIARGTKAALDRIERRLDTMDGRLDRMTSTFDGWFERMEARIDRIASEHRTDFRRLLSLILGGNGALLGIMAHGVHWL